MSHGYHVTAPAFILMITRHAAAVVCHTAPFAAVTLMLPCHNALIVASHAVAVYVTYVMLAAVIKMPPCYGARLMFFR